MKIDTDKLKEIGAKVLESAKRNGTEFLDTMKEGGIGIGLAVQSVAKNGAVEGKKVLEVAQKETKKTVNAVKVGVNATLNAMKDQPEQED